MHVAQAAVAGRRRVGQLPIFAAASADPSPFDLAGLLIGPGQVVRMGGTARVSVVVDAPWRVHALAGELTLRGLGLQWEPSETVEGHFAVRTAYAGVLAPLSALWLRGAVKSPTGWLPAGRGPAAAVVHRRRGRRTRLARPAAAGRAERRGLLGAGGPGAGRTRLSGGGGARTRSQDLRPSPDPALRRADR